MIYKLSFVIAAVLMISAFITSQDSKFDLQHIIIIVSATYLIATAIIGIDFVLSLLKRHKAGPLLTVTIELITILILFMAPILLSFAAAYRIALDLTYKQLRSRHNGQTKDT